jgi:hypothetical protein
MSTGILGQAVLAAVTSTTVYTVPAGKTASLTVSFCNMNSSDTVKVRLSLTPASTAANTSNYLEYDTNIPPNGILERGAIVAGQNENIIVRATSADVSVSVYGIEE